jgi:site-specific DNA recombinase
MDEKKRIDGQMFKTDENIKMLTDELDKLKNTDRLLEEMSIDFDINLPEVWQDETDPTMQAWKEHTIREAIKTNRIDQNKEKIVETVTFEEKCAMVAKYIKQITMYGKETPIKIKVEFNIPVPPMELLIESRYYGAKNLTTQKQFFLRGFGKQPLVIYRRMQEEFNNFSK